jgi:hypothetical protein
MKVNKESFTKQLEKLEKQYEDSYYKQFHSVEKRETQADVQSAMNWRQNFESLTYGYRIFVFSKSIIVKDTIYGSGKNRFTSVKEAIEFFKSIKTNFENSWE